MSPRAHDDRAARVALMRSLVHMLSHDVDRLCRGVVVPAQLGADIIERTSKLGELTRDFIKEADPDHG